MLSKSVVCAVVVKGARGGTKLDLYIAVPLTTRKSEM